MTMLADLLSTVFERRMRFLPGAAADDSRSTEDLAAALVGTDGEISGQQLGRIILDRYAGMDPAGKRAFFDHLAHAMDFDPGEVRRALAAWEDSPDKDTYRRFTTAAEPPRQELIRRLNRVPQATGQLVAMRADLLSMAKNDPALAALDYDFQHLFSSWFNRGFLVLRPISWESPAHILDRIIAYEAVHAIDSWDDLRRRLEPADRRCFAFFHPSMPDEPLIFVEVALTKGIANSIQSLLAEDREAHAAEDADTAVFYSISNCQAGLANISFGNSLIKQVARDLALEVPGISNFVTLSPIPGFNRWLESKGIEVDEGDVTAIRRLAACYLAREKNDAGLPLDPVARFHLSNGAQIHAIHANADLSDSGLSRSRGVMVNYLYELNRITDNLRQLADKGQVAVSGTVRTLARQGAQALEKPG